MNDDDDDNLDIPRNKNGKKDSDGDISPGWKIIHIIDSSKKVKQIFLVNLLFKKFDEKRRHMMMTKTWTVSQEREMLK